MTKMTVFKRFFSFLPFLFISITIACIFILFSIISTQKNEVLNAIEQIGADKLSLSPYIYEICDGKDLKYTGASISQLEENILYIKKRCKEIKNITIETRENNPMAMAGGKWSFDEWHRFLLPPIYVEGVTPDYKPIQNLKLIHGRFINELDMKMKRRVCVIGNTTYHLLCREKIINKKIKVECYPNETFTVIGCLKTSKPFLLPFVSDMFGDVTDNADPFLSTINSTIFIPYTAFKECRPTAEKTWTEILITVSLNKKQKEHQDYQESKEEWWNLSTTYTDTEKRFKKSNERWKTMLGPKYHEVARIKNKIISILQEKYGENKYFLIAPNKRLLEEYEEHFHSFNMFITNIGCVSVIGSLIFILSMMLFSVSTRTTEIGIRRAIGARKRDIFFQFLKEGIIITGKGGIGGIILGILTVYLLGKCTGWEMVFPWYGLFFSISAIGIIGIIGGLYPAMKAANIPPAVAVKYE